MEPMSALRIDMVRKIILIYTYIYLLNMSIIYAIILYQYEYRSIWTILCFGLGAQLIPPFAYFDTGCKLQIEPF